MYKAKNKQLSSWKKQVFLIQVEQFSTPGNKFLKDMCSRMDPLHSKWPNFGPFGRDARYSRPVNTPKTLYTYLLLRDLGIAEAT
jgi:hypothetical protein